MKPTSFPTPVAFRAWLEQHHAKVDVLLVGSYKKGSGQEGEQIGKEKGKRKKEKRKEDAARFVFNKSRLQICWRRTYAQRKRAASSFLLRRLRGRLDGRYCLLLFQLPGAWWLMLAAAVGTLWFLPIGTIFSLVQVILLLR
jgi:hypothetical protein